MSFICMSPMTIHFISSFVIKKSISKDSERFTYYLFFTKKYKLTIFKSIFYNFSSRIFFLIMAWIYKVISLLLNKFIDQTYVYS